MFGDRFLMEKLKEYRYKTEMHCHSAPASPCAEMTPENIVKTYSSMSYDAVVLTNHFHLGLLRDGESVRDYVKRYNEDYFKTRDAAEEYGLRIIYGMEARFTVNSNDFLVYGVDENESEYLLPKLAEDLRRFREEYQNDGMVFIQAHPCRFGCLKSEPWLLDGVEVINLHPEHNSAIGYAAKYAREVGGVMVSGSDYHHAGMAGLGGIFTKKLPEDTHELARILKNGDYLLNIGGMPVIPDFIK